MPDIVNDDFRYDCGDKQAIPRTQTWFREDLATVTSRDGSNRSNRPYRPTDGQRSANTPPAQFGLDANELDRYMSGQPAREPRFDPYGRQQGTGQTARVPAQSQPRQIPAETYSEYDDELWDDDQYDDNGSYEADADYEQNYAPAPPQRRGSQPRSRQRVQEYDDDLYEDPYVLDDEEIEERPRPRRQQNREPRPRVQRQAPTLTIPAFISDAAIVKDRVALGLLAANVVSALILIILVATRRDGLGDVIISHVDANGAAGRIEDTSAIWRLPLIASMMTLINGVLAWYISRWGQFLPRFLLGGAVGVQFIVWVAIIAHLF